MSRPFVYLDTLTVAVILIVLYKHKASLYKFCTEVLKLLTKV